MQIDHDPEEQKPDRGPGPWRIVFPIIAVGWAGSLYFGMVQWHSVALGIGTGCVLTAWAIEVTGNKIPASWRRKPTGDRRS